MITTLLHCHDWFSWNKSYTKWRGFAALPTWSYKDHTFLIRVPRDWLAKNSNIYMLHKVCKVLLLFYSTGVPVAECGIFFREGLGASPDGIADKHLLEIKTRAKGAKAHFRRLKSICSVRSNCNCSALGGPSVT